MLHRLFICVCLINKLSSVVDMKVFFVGKNCTLPCSFPPGTDLVIYWYKDGRRIIVYSYQNNTGRLEYQHKDFKDRILPFLDQLSTGNTSIILQNLQVEDQGTYMCKVRTKRGRTITIIVKVKGTRHVQLINTLNHWFVLSLFVSVLL